MIKSCAQYLLHLLFLATRPLTVGVRGILYDANSNSVILVKNTYAEDWAIPGGGVEAGESMELALKRELAEEVGLLCNGLRIQTIYHNKTISKRDHVVIYTVDAWTTLTGHETPKHEIAATQWFQLSNLPINLTPCTKCALEQFNPLAPDQTPGSP